jgi:hypothetical protein
MQGGRKVTINNNLRLIIVTFIEGALGAWAITGFAVDTFDAKIVLGGGVAAVISAIYNFIREMGGRVTPSLGPNSMGFDGAEGVPSSEEGEEKA